MRLYVGTSGWSYKWNRGHSLKWYVENTPFNTVELNASFYRFPYENYILSWKRHAGDKLKFSIKVHRFITHIYRFDERSYPVWDKMKNLFEPLEENISFYLFQLPPSLTPEKKEVIRKFIDYTGLGKRFALEFRNKLWFRETHPEFRDITLVTVSAPHLPLTIFHNQNTVYMRFHGISEWYKYVYSEDELLKILGKIKELEKEVKVAYFYFNNDIGMFQNALTMAKLCGLL